MKKSDKTNHCCNHTDAALQIDLTAGENELRLIDDLIQSMNNPSAVISEIAIGSKFVGIQADSDGTACVGLASTLGFVPTEEENQMAANLCGKTLSEAVMLLKATSGFSVSIGAAALNAGLTPPQGQSDVEASQILAEKGREGETVLVGDFPFTDRLREQVKKLHLFELRDAPGRIDPDEGDDILKRCSVLGLTGTILITRAMASYLEKAPQAFTIIIGPTTPLSPALFSYGADILAGCRVIDAETVFEGIRKGWSFREFKQLGVEFIAWPKDG